MKPSLSLANGEVAQIASSLPQELSSLDDLTSRYLAESWLLQAGILSETAVQTLMLYGYGQKGVKKVVLEVDQQSRAPSVHYKIELNPYCALRYRKYMEAVNSKGEIFKRLRMLFWAWMGAPVSVQTNVISMARQYLPSNYTVTAEIL